ncbi:MAG TPA: PDZ domain-containing protein [Polyangia bacterium]
MRIARARLCALFGLAAFWGAGGFGTARAAERSAGEIAFQIDLGERTRHLAMVEMTVPDAPSPLELAMPVWTPGAYELRTWGRNVRLLGAVDGSGRPLTARRTGPSTFVVEGQRAGGEVRLRYQVYAALLSDDASQVDGSHAYLNGTSIFLIARGQEKRRQRVRLAAPEGWRIATALAAAPGGGLVAPGYEALVDAPIEVGRFADGEVRAAGRSYRIAIDGAEKIPARLARDLARIAEAEVAIVGPPPYARYLLLIHLADGFGRVAALEHAASTSILVPRSSLAGGEPYDELLYVIAHELFHAWNARLLRPAELVPYDLLHPTLSRSLWITEGLTEYFAHRALLRAGIWSTKKYLERIGEEAARAVDDARRGRTIEEDAELTWQSPDEDAEDPDAYYARGHLVALALDSSIRAATRGKKSLADVLRALLAKAAIAGNLLPVDGRVLARAIGDQAGAEVAAEVSDFTARPHEPTRMSAALGGLGLALQIGEEPDQAFAGFSANFESSVLRVDRVAPGGPAERAGLRPGDRILTIANKPPVRSWLAALRLRAPGVTVAVEALRASRRLLFALELEPAPSVRCRLAEIPASPTVVKWRDAWLSPRRR